MKCLFLTAVGILTTTPVGAAEFDANGCRRLSELPAPGVHPRVFFTADEYPRMKERLAAPRFHTIFGPIQHQIVQSVRREWTGFSNLDLSDSTDAQIIQYLRSGEGRNINWGVASLTSVLTDDAELRDLMKKVIVNYGRIILASKKRAEQTASGTAVGSELANCLKLWRSDAYDVGVSWTLGASGYAVSYDVLYNDMTEDQRDIVRQAIAVGTRGRKSYGNGMPRGYASSNHYGYHGDLAVLLAAIEGEPGFDQATWDGIVQVLTDYWEIGYTPFGACREDGYGPNLGLRGGGRGLMVLARRGHNVFATEKFRRYLNYVALEYDPYPGGHFNGGASGGPYGELYPTSTLIARYMYPDNLVANFNYRHLIGDTYERRLRWQGWLDYLLYGTDWKGPEERSDMPRQAGLPLSVFYPVRGKFIARSDWSNNAMYATLDARPDAHLIGHDKVDRGNFSMSALGRVWAFSGDFHNWNLSRENSLVHIDGRAEAWKAPSVRFLWHDDDGTIAGAAADLKYAYDWQWSPPWPKWGQHFDPPWEPETSSPLDLGWPAQHVIPEICPKSIHGSETGYGGTNNLHRRSFNPVAKAFRSLYLVRGPHPYTLICDDIRKDDASHLYEWIMQLPVDLMIDSRKLNQVVLKEAKGDRRLLVQFLENTCATKVESYEADKNPKTGDITLGKRLVASLNAVAPDFRVLLYPFHAGQPLPASEWNQGHTTLTIALAGQTDQLMFFAKAESGTKVVLTNRSNRKGSQDE